MSLKDRMTKLRKDSPLLTVAGLVEITLHGGQLEGREGDFLSVAAQVLKVSQAEVDEAVAFTREIEPPEGYILMTIKMQEQFVAFVRQLASTETPEDGENAKKLLAIAIDGAKLLEEAWASRNR